MGNFDGKVAIVTGGTSGIGRSASLLYAKQGAKVVVSGRREAEGEETVRLIREAGGEAIFVRADVSVAEDVQNLVEKTLATYGRLDAAFNNAGTEGTFGPLVEQDEKVWDHTLDVNLKGAWLSLKYEIPALLRSGGGSIAFNASVVGLKGFAGTAIYSASKGGVLALARAAAVEYAGQNIRVNVINPGPVETAMPERAFGSIEAFKEFAAPHLPIKRIGQPDEVAEAAVWITSDAASFVTGQILNVDGGATA